MDPHVIPWVRISRTLYRHYFKKCLYLGKYLISLKIRGTFVTRQFPVTRKIHNHKSQQSRREILSGLFSLVEPTTRDKLCPRLIWTRSQSGNWQVGSDVFKRLRENLFRSFWQICLNVKVKYCKNSLLLTCYLQTLLFLFWACYVSRIRHFLNGSTILPGVEILPSFGSQSACLHV